MYRIPSKIYRQHTSHIFTLRRIAVISLDVGHIKFKLNHNKFMVQSYINLLSVRLYTIYTHKSYRMLCTRDYNQTRTHNHMKLFVFNFRYLYGYGKYNNIQNTILNTHAFITLISVEIICSVISFVVIVSCYNGTRKSFFLRNKELEILYPFDQIILRKVQTKNHLEM